MLGICVVYLLNDAESQKFLHLSLNHIKATTKSEYRIYGVTSRMLDTNKKHLTPDDAKLKTTSKQALDREIVN